MEIKFEKKKFNEEKVVVEFVDPVLKQPHQLLLPKDMSDEDIQKEIKKYLYGYTDENGNHVPGYLDVYKR